MPSFYFRLILCTFGKGLMPIKKLRYNPHSLLECVLARGQQRGRGIECEFHVSAGRVASHGLELFRPTSQVSLSDGEVVLAAAGTKTRCERTKKDRVQRHAAARCNLPERCDSVRGDNALHRS